MVCGWIQFVWLFPLPETTPPPLPGTDRLSIEMLTKTLPYATVTSGRRYFNNKKVAKHNYKCLKVCVFKLKLRPAVHLKFRGVYPFIICRESHDSFLLPATKAI